MDYLFFVYGLAFILLAVTAQALARSREGGMPWRWLALFGCLHGLNEWCDMLAMDVGDVPFFALGRVLLLAVSFLMLLEFGRRGVAVVAGKGPGVWTLAPFLLLAGEGQLFGLAGFAAAVRYALGFTGAVWAAWVLWEYGVRTAVPGSRRRMGVACGALLGYAVASGLIVGAAPFFPANVLNTQGFLGTFGVPVQLVRCGLACVLAICVWQQYAVWRRFLGPGPRAVTHAAYEWWTAAALIIVLALGWEATEQMDAHTDRRERGELLRMAQGVEAGMAPALVRELSGDRRALAEGGTARLRELCRHVTQSSAGARAVYLLDRRNGALFVTAEARAGAPFGPPERLPVAREEPYWDAPSELVRAFATGLPGVAGPYTDQWGTFLSAFVPVHDPATRRVVGVLGLDIDAELWASDLRLIRTGPVALTMLLCGVILAYFITWRRTQEETFRRTADLARVRRQQTAVYSIATSNVVAAGDFEVAARAITEATAAAMDADRISVWLLGPAEGDFRCVELFERSTARHSAGITLKVADYPVFFAAMSAGRAIDAHEACTDPRTREFTDSYFRPREIGALLAAPIRSHGRVIGMVCLAGLGKPRTWLPDEVRFIGEIADQTGHALIDAERRETLRALERAHDELETRVAERTEDLKSALVNLRGAEERYRTLVAQIPGVVYRSQVHAPRQALFMSGGTELVTGYVAADFLGPDAVRHWGDLILDEDEALAEGSVAEGVAGNRAYAVEYRIRHADGTIRWVTDCGQACYGADGAPLWLDGVVFDVSDRRKAEAERQALDARILHTQKMESLGVMAGGLAHDFNNILMAILGNVDLALMDVPAESPVRTNLVEIERACRRATDLCRQMLSYSGKGRLHVERLDLNVMLRDMESLFAASLPKKVKLQLNLADGLPAVEGDTVQIRQVVTNLVLNAAEAVDERNGTIVVGTAVRHCDRALLGAMWQHEERPEGDYVCIEVTDSGRGMTAETQARMFEPFFTTKFAGRGLGLAAVFGIVRGHRGAIRVQSAPWQGTTVQVFLPLAATDAGGEPDAPAVATFRAGGVVLLVDDEDAVREAARKHLERLGFEVLPARNGREAMDTFALHRHRIRVILLDLTMPVMDGRATLRELARTNGHVPVIVCSGYSEQAAGLQAAAESGVVGFIEKPYPVSRLIALLNRVLADPA